MAPSWDALYETAAAQSGVASHETALLFSDLSDALPANMHITVPAAWHQRRVRTSNGVVLHYADVPETERGWMGPVPMTDAPRTIRGLHRRRRAPRPRAAGDR